MFYNVAEEHAIAECLDVFQERFSFGPKYAVYVSFAIVFDIIITKHVANVGKYMLKQ